jgi:predicted nucleotidyltransferase
MDKTEDIISMAKKYSELVKASSLPIKIGKTYLFGSFAKGTPHKDSDIDIAFVVSNWTGGYFDTVVPIWNLCRNIDVRIEPHIIDPKEDYAYFLREIQKTGILIK